MRLMKKTLGTVAALALSVSLLVGCGSAASSTAASVASSAAESTASSVEEAASSAVDEDAAAAAQLLKDLTGSYQELWPVILADEPTGALDSHTGREVLGMLQQMHDEGHTVVLITHDNSIAVQADRIIRLEDGRVVYDGDAHAPEAVVQPTLLPETPDEEEKA